MPGKDQRDRHGSGVSSNISSSSSSSFSHLDPPNGGWGWVVVFGSFTAHMIADGLSFSFGVFYMELLDYFKESRGKTALVGSLFLSVPLITGPMASALINKYGCRSTTIMGGFIAGSSFVISGFVNSIEMLCFTFGILAGIGLAMVYVPAIVVVAFYFESKRAFATGIAVAGSGIGTFLFAPLTEFLIDKYTWRGAFVILGAITFNIMVSGMAFRPLTTPKLEKKRRKYLENLGKFSKLDSYSSMQKPGLKTNLTRHRTEKINRPLSNEADLLTLLNQPVTHSLMQFPTFLKDNMEPTCFKELQKYMVRNPRETETLYEVLQNQGLLEKFVNYHSDNTVQAVSVLELERAKSVAADFGGSDREIASPKLEGANVNKLSPNVVDFSGSTFSQLGVGSRNKESDTTSKRTDVTQTSNMSRKQLYSTRASKKQLELDQMLPLSRKDIFYRGSLLKSVEVKPESHSASCPNIVLHYKVDSTGADENIVYKFFTLSTGKAKNLIHKMMNLSILRSSVFLYFCVASFLLYFAYDVPYVFTPDKAIEMDFSQARASFLVSIIGITSTVGQIVIGWLGDFPSINPLHLYNVLTSLSGLITITVPWLRTYSLLGTYCGLFGFLISANYSLTTIILVHLLGMDKLTNAYGIVMLFEGIGNLLGPPAAGMLSDHTGSYDMTFIVFGIIMFMSGCMLTFIPCLKRCDRSLGAEDDKSEVKKDNDEIIITVEDTTTCVTDDEDKADVTEPLKNPRKSPISPFD